MSDFGRKKNPKDAEGETNTELWMHKIFFNVRRVKFEWRIKYNFGGKETFFSFKFENDFGKILGNRNHTSPVESRLTKSAISSF